MKKLYVISGVAGMTGSELVHQILQKPGEENRILGFDNFFASSVDTIQQYVKDDRFDFYEYDLNCRREMSEIEKAASAKKEFDEVIYINCAAVVHTEHFYHVYETYQTNVEGMKTFLEQAIRVGAEKFINCSTSEVYSMNSWNDCGGVREEDFLQIATAEHSQRTSYAIGKLLTEFFLKDAVDQRKIKGCSVRFANVYSKNEKYPKHIIPYICHSLKDSEKVVLLENSRKNKRTFLHNYDSCSAVLALLEADKALDGSIYNVATDEEISILDLVALIAEKMKIKDPMIEFKGYRASDPERRLLSTEKLRTRTGWRPKVGLSQGLDACIEHMMQKG